jgi:hypothetical protein
VGSGGKHLCDNRHLGIFTDLNGGPKPGQAGPDNDDVKFMLHGLPHISLCGALVNPSETF